MNKTLIAYFSHSGNTQALASSIADSTGGDLFEIKTVESYPTDYNAVVAKARDEQKANLRPTLTAKVPNMDGYDTLFIGYPNWWGTIPMGVFTFLETYRLTGKTIIPFCTHEGSGLGRSVADIQRICPASRVFDGMAIRGSSVKRAQEELSAWLRNLPIWVRSATESEASSYVRPVGEATRR